ncbi:unnamed protein product [Rhodiola kirilowii]
MNAMSSSQLLPKFFIFNFFPNYSSSAEILHFTKSAMSQTRKSIGHLVITMSFFMLFLNPTQAQISINTIRPGQTMRFKDDLTSPIGQYKPAFFTPKPKKLS